MQENWMVAGENHENCGGFSENYVYTKVIICQMQVSIYLLFVLTVIWETQGILFK